MARPVGSLAVRLTADTSEFQRRMKRATRNLRSMSREMRSAVNTAGKYAGAITAAGTAIGTHLVRNSLKSVDALAKTSDKLGIAVADLQGLRQAAELSGVGLNQLEMGIQRMTRRVSEAAQGMGEAQDAIKELGLNANELNQLSPDEMFMRIAGAMEGVNNQSDRIRLAFKLFDSEGVNLINTLRMGEDGLRSIRKEIDEYGIALTRVDAAKVEAANDAITRSANILEGVINRVVVELAPFIESAAEEFAGAAKETNGFRREILSAVETSLRGFGHVANTIRGVQVAIKSAELALAGFNLLVAEAANKGSDFQDSWVMALPIQGLKNLGIEIGSTKEQTDDFARAMRSHVDLVKQELHELAMQPMPGEAVADTIDRIRKSAEIAAQEIAKSRERVMGGLEGGEGGKDGEAEKRKEQLENRLNQLREGLMTEREVELEHQMQRGEILREAFERDLLTFQEFKRLTEEAAAAHQKRMTEIEKEGLSERQKFQRSGLRSQAKTIFGQLDNITAGVSQHNKELFRLNQIAGIANAIINAYEGIALTMSKYPYPLNIAMAAAHATAAFAQVNAIRSATFDGGGGTAPSLSGGTAAPPVSDVGREGGSSQTVMINLRGSESATFSRQQVRDLIEQINEASDDGAKVVVS